MNDDGDIQGSHDDTASNMPPADCTKKDSWDKFSIIGKTIGGIVTAVIVVTFGFFTNNYLHKKQKIDSNLQLYTQLLSNKESSDNKLRSDMFSKILQSFLSDKSGNKENTIDNLTKIREQLLHLNLLTRNFHESLDLNPLFEHVLMEIVRARITLRKCHESHFDEIIDKYSPEIYTVTKKNTDKTKEEKITEITKYYDRALMNLIAIAKRVTRKQAEVLEDVSEVSELIIPIGDVCAEYRPSDLIPSLNSPEYKNTECSVSKGSNTGNVVEGGTRGYETKCRDFKQAKKHVYCSLILKAMSSDKTADRINKGLDPDRHFEVRVRYLYPKWNRVRVDVYTATKDEEIDYTKPESSFWLGYFDFPLVDNTYINERERYAVILDGFVEDYDEEEKDVEKIAAKIRLIYYPAAYAGLKEKSFYNTKLMKNLVKRDFFEYEEDKSFLCLHLGIGCETRRSDEPQARK